MTENVRVSVDAATQAIFQQLGDQLTDALAEEPAWVGSLRAALSDQRKAPPWVQELKASLETRIESRASRDDVAALHSVIRGLKHELELMRQTLNVNNERLARVELPWYRRLFLPKRTQ